MSRNMQPGTEVVPSRVREAGLEELARHHGDIQTSDVELAWVSEPEPGAVTFKPEPFDSQLLGIRIGRIVSLRAMTAAGYDALLSALIRRVGQLGYAQVLRRTGLEHLQETWALGRHRFELMDVGLVFVRWLKDRLEEPEYADLNVRHANDADVEAIVAGMLDEPWGSRYEADPGYTGERVRALRTRWLRNSYRGRAAAFFVGAIDGEPAGYVICLLDPSERRGEIDLVGTLPSYRGRKVASRVLEHAMAWFSERAAVVTVRTQATNYAAAALYEKCGFSLHASDATYRCQL
jgi:GNAT superfamily N-acetyltransferase